MANDQTTTGENEYTKLVNDIWDNRGATNEARGQLRRALEANNERQDEELKAVADARDELNKKVSEANAELNKKEREITETRKQADKAARKAFRDTVGDEVEERVGYF